MKFLVYRHGETGFDFGTQDNGAWRTDEALFDTREEAEDLYKKLQKDDCGFGYGYETTEMTEVPDDYVLGQRNC